MINLREAIEIMESSDDPTALLSDERLIEFTSAVEDAGIEIMKPLAEEGEGEYAKAAVAFVQSGVIASLLSRTNDPLEMLKILQLMQSDLFFTIITLAFKYSVGLAAIEELR